MEKAKRIASQVWDKVFGKEFLTDSFDDQRFIRGIRYLVKKHSDGHWSCNCPSYKFRSGVRHYKGHFPTCKHIRHHIDKEGEQ